MNAPQYVEAAVAFGKRMLEEGGETHEARLAYGFNLATGRQPTSQERELLSHALEKHLSRYLEGPAAALELAGEKSPEPAAYSMVANTLLNLDELITRP